MIKPPIEELLKDQGKKVFHEGEYGPIVESNELFDDYEAYQRRAMRQASPTCEASTGVKRRRTARAPVAGFAGAVVEGGDREARRETGDGVTGSVY